MRAVLFDSPGDESVLYLGEASPPELRDSEIRIRVRATAVNRADLLQRQGKYPPPPGASGILGLECAGEVIEAGRDVGGWNAGDRAMALLAGGGYAAEAAVDARSAMRVPEEWSWEEAAAFPEVFLTAYLNVFMIGGAARGASVLVHGGGSGVGTAAIVLCREAGAVAIVTAGSREKCDRCVELGAAAAINYREDDFAARVAEITSGRGVDVILDHIGASYLSKNLSSLARGGRLVCIGTMGGRKGELDFAQLLAKRAQIIGSTLRTRPVEEKGAIVDAFVERFGDAMNAGRIRPVVDSVFSLEDVAAAHRYVASSGHFGKVVLKNAEC
jgi:putative PIG3 family NAD(P)H quinone oxidoreductase